MRSEEEIRNAMEIIGEDYIRPKDISKWKKDSFEYGYFTGKMDALEWMLGQTRSTQLIGNFEIEIGDYNSSQGLPMRSEEEIRNAIEDIGEEYNNLDLPDGDNFQFGYFVGRMYVLGWVLRETGSRLLFRHSNYEDFEWESVGDSYRPICSLSPCIWGKVYATRPRLKT